MDVRGDFLGPPHCTTTRTLLIKVNRPKNKIEQEQFSEFSESHLSSFMYHVFAIYTHTRVIWKVRSMIVFLSNQ